MTIKEAKKLKDHDYVTDNNRLYHVRIHHWNKHDLWFYHCRKGSKVLLYSGKVTRVYLGSRNLSSDNLVFLDDLQPE